jgi:hypothetical protein
VTPQEGTSFRRYSRRSSSHKLFLWFVDLKNFYRRRVERVSQVSLNKNLEDIRTLFVESFGLPTNLRIMAVPPPWVKNVYKALDISRIKDPQMTCQRNITSGFQSSLVIM